MYLSEKIIDFNTGNIIKHEDVKTGQKLIIEVVEEVPRYYAFNGELLIDNPVEIAHG